MFENKKMHSEEKKKTNKKKQSEEVRYSVEYCSMLVLV